MKQLLHLKTMLVTLLTMLVAMNASAQTQNYFSCNFDSYTNTGILTSNGWTMGGTVNMNTNSPYCYSGRAVQLGTKNGADGQVTTPALNTSLPSDVQLSFYTGTGQYNEVSLTVTVLGAGSFLNSDNTTSESVTISVTKSGGKFYTYNLTGCTSATKIKFYANKIAGLDNVVVSGAADPRTPVTLEYSADKYTTATESGEITGAPTLTVTPAEAASEVVFSSSDENVAKFDENGKLIAVATGTTTITASISGSETYRDAEDSYELTVGLPSSNLRYNPTSVTVTYDKKDNFTAPELSYTGGYDGTITYTSDNPSVATVDANGVVTILAVGVAKITASGAATQYLKESEADFTLTVNDIQGSATGGTGESVFKETFDKADSSGGNDGSFSSASSQVMTNNNVCDNTGWTGAMYKAKKCVKVGTGSETWKVTTPEINVEPNIPYTLIFKAAPWANESSTKMKVTVTGGSIEGISTGNMTTGKWNDFSANITPNSSSIKINFSVTDGKRFFLDEINVAAPSTSETVDVTIPASGWGTFCYQYPLDFTVEAIPEGLKVYAVSSSSTTNVTLSEINQKLIGGTGMIINGTPGKAYTLKIADKGTAYSGTNLLTGTLSPTYIEKGQYFLKNGQFVYSSAGTLPANKAYLKSANAPEAAANLDFVVEDVTGISVMRNAVIEKDGRWYDISGRAVSPTSKGIYIHNGKKYVIK
ncbi:MAG: Ig-like domain-containing protein [Prevotellaceae bacterium]|nr:Ig-like domain-containing protein [Prevotellaceae bacterium]